MISDEELAAVRSGLPIDKNADGTPVDPTLSLMAELVVQVTRVADNTSRPELHVSAADAVKAWESTGMRMYADRFVEALRNVGVTVDEDEPTR